MKQVYMACDGKIFNDKDECRKYEEDILGYKIYEVELFYNGTYSTWIKARSKSEAIELAKKEAWPEYISHDFIRADIKLKDI